MATKSITVEVSQRPGPGSIAVNAEPWTDSLHAANLSPRTIQSYREATRLLEEFLTAQGMPTDVAAIRREHVEAFIRDQLERWKPTTAAVRYAGLKVFFGWLVNEGEVKDSPMARMRKPRVGTRLIDFPTEAEVKAVLASCDTRTFDGRRDLAILQVFLSTGARLSEVAGLQVSDVDFERHERHAIITVTGKGDRQRQSLLDADARAALKWYLIKVRPSHPAAGSPWVWLGRKGRLTESGISQMIRDRGERLGIKIHPHAFRHRYADRMLSQGMHEGTVMQLGGWRTREMLDRYGAARKADRALEEASRIAIENGR